MINNIIHHREEVTRTQEKQPDLHSSPLRAALSVKQWSQIQIFALVHIDCTLPASHSHYWMYKNITMKKKEVEANVTGEWRSSCDCDLTSLKASAQTLSIWPKKVQCSLFTLWESKSLYTGLYISELNLKTSLHKIILICRHSSSVRADKLRIIRGYPVSGFPLFFLLLIFSFFLFWTDKKDKH